MTEYKGKQAFPVVPELSTLKGYTVLKPSEEVLKPVEETVAESRLSALKSSIDVVNTKIDELNNFLFKNNDDNSHELSKNDGLGAIRTPDLRHVKATS